MTRTILAIAATLAMTAVPAYATPGNNGGGHGGCGVGQKTNGCGDPATPDPAPAPAPTATATSHATSSASAQAAAIVEQRQRQQQAQQQVANGGEGGKGGNAMSIASGGQGGKGGAGGSGYGGSATLVSGPTTSLSEGGEALAVSGGNHFDGGEQATTVTVDNHTLYEQSRIPVATAYAAPLTASNGTCMGSSSVGGQGVTVGLSFATTWTDEGCQARYDASYLDALGLRDAAIERLCLRDDMAAAIEAAGHTCRVRAQTDSAQPTARNSQTASSRVADAGGPVYLN